MAARQISRLNPTHYAIMRWLVQPANLGPGHMRRCAAQFEVTESWLSTLVHTDMFQARWKDLQKDIDQGMIPTIEDELRGTAALAVEKLQSRIVSGGLSSEMLLNIAKETTHALGMGPKAAAPAQQSTQIYFNLEDLNAARERNVEAYLNPDVGRSVEPGAALEAPARDSDGESTEGDTL